MTITLSAVYVPIGFQGGLTGSLFREFAFTLAGAVFISGIVALTLSPMMSSRMIRPQHNPGWLTRNIDRTFEAVRRRYSRMLDVVLANRPAVYVGWVVLTLLTVPMYMFSAAELAPNEDQGVVFTSLDLPANATLEQLTPYTEQVGQMFTSVPEADSAFQLTFPSAGFGGVLVMPWSERERSIFPIQNELGAKMANVAGVRAPAFLPPPLPSDGFFPVEVVLASTADHKEMLGFAEQLQQAAAASGQFAFPPMLDVKIDQARTEIVIDRDKAASMGLSMQQLGMDLSALLGGNFVNRFSIEGRSYKVIPQVERAARLTPDQLDDLFVT